MATTIHVRSPRSESFAVHPDPASAGPAPRPTPRTWPCRGLAFRTRRPRSDSMASARATKLPVIACGVAPVRLQHVKAIVTGALAQSARRSTHGAQASGRSGGAGFPWGSGRSVCRRAPRAPLRVCVARPVSMPVLPAGDPALPFAAQSRRGQPSSTHRVQQHAPCRTAFISMQHRSFRVAGVVARESARRADGCGGAIVCCGKPCATPEKRQCDGRGVVRSWDRRPPPTAPPSPCRASARGNFRHGEGAGRWSRSLLPAHSRRCTPAATSPLSRRWRQAQGPSLASNASPRCTIRRSCASGDSAPCSGTDDAPRSSHLDVTVIAGTRHNRPRATRSPCVWVPTREWAPYWLRLRRQPRLPFAARAGLWRVPAITVHVEVLLREGVIGPEQAQESPRCATRRIVHRGRGVAARDGLEPAPAPGERRRAAGVHRRAVGRQQRPRPFAGGLRPWRKFLWLDALQGLGAQSVRRRSQLRPTPRPSHCAFWSSTMASRNKRSRRRCPARRAASRATTPATRKDRCSSIAATRACCARRVSMTACPRSWRGQRAGLGHRGVRHAAARHAHAHGAREAARGKQNRPNPGNPAPDRPLAARRGRSAGAGRAHGDDRL